MAKYHFPLYIFIFLYLNSVTQSIAGAQVAEWMIADERAEIAWQKNNLELAAEEAERAIELYENNVDTFDADIYSSLVERLAELHSSRGNGRAAVFALSRGIDELLDRRGFRNSELLRLYKEQARYYDLMFDFKKADWRLRMRVNLAERFLEKGSEERLSVRLERLSWLIGRGSASPETLQSLLQSARDEIGQESLSSRSWLMEYEARIAEYADEMGRAEEISKNLLELVGRLRNGDTILSSIYSRLGRIYLHSGREDAFLELLARAAAHQNSEIRDTAIIHPLQRFSAAAEARGLVAKFTLRVEVDAEGRVRDLKLVESNANGKLQEEFLRAVKTEWRFLPGLDADGRRVPRTISSSYFEFAAPNNVRRFLR